jgi:sugar/nucleoside kinase (ribokinase family)
MFLVNTIMARRHTLAGDDEPRPIFVWEPIPDLCTPEEYARLRETAKLVDVVSPNADEFASFFTSHPKCTTRESMVEHFLGLDQEPESTPLEAALVIREGAQGCTTYLGGAKTKLHLHAFHQSAERVIDPTGGGNTFLGALAMATTGAAFPTEKDILTESNIPESKFSRQKLLFGLLHATVAASYSIEQMGVSIPSETDPDCWNGESYRDRLLAFLAREKEHIISQITKESSDS